jgi:hypothetical protein
MPSNGRPLEEEEEDIRGLAIQFSDWCKKK